MGFLFSVGMLTVGMLTVTLERSWGTGVSESIGIGWVSPLDPGILVVRDEESSWVVLVAMGWLEVYLYRYSKLKLKLLLTNILREVGDRILAVSGMFGVLAWSLNQKISTNDHLPKLRVNSNPTSYPTQKRHHEVSRKALYISDRVQQQSQ